MQKGQYCEWPSMQPSKGTEEKIAFSTEAFHAEPLFPCYTGNISNIWSDLTQV